MLPLSEEVLLLDLHNMKEEGRSFSEAALYVALWASHREGDASSSGFNYRKWSWEAMHIVGNNPMDSIPRLIKELGESFYLFGERPAADLLKILDQVLEIWSIDLGRPKASNVISL